MVMLPPNSDCRPPKKLPTMERERTVMPRTTPRLRTILKPGSVRAVVTMASCMFLSAYRCAMNSEPQLLIGLANDGGSALLQFAPMLTQADRRHDLKRN